MKKFVAIAAAFLLTACGVETATTAATGAAIKKAEIEEGKKTMQRAETKIQGAMQQMQKRAEQDASQ